MAGWQNFVSSRWDVSIFFLLVAVSCCPILLVVVWVPPCFEMFSKIHPIHCLHWDIRELWRGCLILLPNSCDQNTTTKLQQYWSAQPMPAKKHHQHCGKLHWLPNRCIFLRSAAVQTRQVLQFVLWTVQAKIQKIVPKEGISQRHAKPQPEKRSWILCFLGSPAHYISNSQALQGSSYIIHDYVNDVTMPYYACKLISTDLGWVTNCQMLGSRTPELHWLSQSAACRVPALSPSLRSAHLCTKACGVHPIGPLTSEKWNKLNKHKQTLNKRKAAELWRRAGVLDFLPVALSTFRSCTLHAVTLRFERKKKTMDCMGVLFEAQKQGSDDHSLPISHPAHPMFQGLIHAISRPLSDFPEVVGYLMKEFCIVFRRLQDKLMEINESNLRIFQRFELVCSLKTCNWVWHAINRII